MHADNVFTTSGQSVSIGYGKEERAYEKYKSVKPNLKY